MSPLRPCQTVRCCTPTMGRSYAPATQQNHMRYIFQYVGCLMTSQPFPVLSRLPQLQVMLFICRAYLSQDDPSGSPTLDLREVKITAGMVYYFTSQHIFNGTQARPLAAIYWTTCTQSADNHAFQRLEFVSNITNLLIYNQNQDA